MNLSLKGKTILITGGSRGIGQETAIMLAGFGARIIIQYNSDHKSAEQTLNILDNKECDHFVIQADFSNSSDLDIMVSRVLSRVEKIDILVNNAGVFIEKPMKELTFEGWKEVWNKTISVNLTSVAHLSFLFAKHMQEKGGGKIINISSRGAFRGEPNALAYGASKAGLNSLGQSMAKALGKDNIFVYTLAPGFVESDMAKDILASPMGDDIRQQSPLNRVAQPNEIAKTIAFLSEDGCEYLTGSIIDINGASYLRS